MTEERQGRSGDSGKILYCSFCGKSQHEVRKLIAGPSVFICDECVELCNDIIREELEEKGATTRSHLPKPREILEALDQYVVGQSRAKRTLRWPSTTTTNVSKRVAATMKLNSRRAIFCWSAPQAPARHCWLKRLRVYSMCRLRSPMPPR